MPREYGDELKAECAGWTAEQLAEEGIMIDPPLIFLLLNMEEHLLWLRGPISRSDLARRIVDLAEKEGIRAEPGPIDEGLVAALLSWEDEFLALAGMPR